MSTFLQPSSTWSLTGRALRRAVRTPATIVSALVLPVIFLLLFTTILGELLAGRGVDDRQFLPPAIAVQAMLFATTGSAFAIAEDRRTGFADRIRTLPIGHLDAIAARAVADLVRSGASLAVLTTVAVALGMRFRGGVGGTLAYVLLALGFALAGALLMGLVGHRASSPASAVSAASVVQLPLLMFSAAFTPVDDLPAGLRTFAQLQPVTVVIDGLRASISAEPDLSSIGAALGWIAAIAAVSAVAVVRNAR